MNSHPADPLAPSLASAGKSQPKDLFRRLSVALWCIAAAIRRWKNSQRVQRKPANNPFEHQCWPPIVFEQNFCSPPRRSTAYTPQLSPLPILFLSFSYASPFFVPSSRNYVGLCAPPAPCLLQGVWPSYLCNSGNREKGNKKYYALEIPRDVGTRSLCRRDW